MSPRHWGSALPSKDPLGWPSQESRAGLVTAAWVSQSPAVTRQAHRDGVGPKSSQKLRSVCDDQQHAHISPGMGMSAAQLGQRAPGRGKTCLVEASRGCSSNTSFQGCAAAAPLMWPSDQAGRPWGQGRCAHRVLTHCNLSSMKVFPFL